MIRLRRKSRLMLVVLCVTCAVFTAAPARRDAPVLGRMLSLAGRLAREQGSPDGFRTIVNTGRIGRQDVMHVHLHVVGGAEPLGPMLPR